MIKVIGVRFKKAGKIYYFDPLDYFVEKDSAVIVETARGIEFGQCVVGIREISDKEIFSPLKPVIRVASQKDLDRHRQNKEKEKEAFTVGEKKIEDHHLEMKLVDVEYTFDHSKVIFYFTADGRIDFRELVKELATIFRTRIELRQIGVRDEAKMLGGIGICGRSLCCSTWLGDFNSVSIKMAKEQNLSLNPSKISGICGRLMCCLNYEQETYEEIRYRLPKVGAVVETSEGKGTVIGNNVIKESVRVRIHDTDDERIESFEIANVTLLKGEYENTAASKEEKEKAEMPKTANNRVPKENIKKKSTRRS
ncbi:MAG: stage 0 sporulation family protein [Clostridium sp.]|nr:stage 0 sporulation family protein [Clostridium sp.]